MILKLAAKGEGVTELTILTAVVVLLIVELFIKSEPLALTSALTVMAVVALLIVELFIIREPPALTLIPPQVVGEGIAIVQRSNTLLLLIISVPPLATVIVRVFVLAKSIKLLKVVVVPAGIVTLPDKVIGPV